MSDNEVKIRIGALIFLLTFVINRFFYPLPEPLYLLLLAASAAYVLYILITSTMKRRGKK